MCGVLKRAQYVWRCFKTCSECLDVCALFLRCLKSCAQPLKVCGVLKLVRNVWRFAPSFCGVNKSCAKPLTVCGVLKLGGMLEGLSLHCAVFNQVERNR